ncbi:Re/Si-specific NAD(P)(+) transhydrogenase subunit alpha [Chitinivorax sp. PXF-14]|uniref:Re/Si-specific NAD(P)(+) transhydrogenase subunit alpha n=1 Tax=Chitinivorax sp. PXF-14 TaxID=3230488 RepID=UPI0034665FAB
MQIGIPAEVLPGETRVAATPDTVKKLIGLGQSVVVQAGAGKLSAITDEAFVAAGAKIGSAADAFNSDIVFKVRQPQADEVAQIKDGAAVVGLFAAHSNTTLPDLAAKKLNCFAMELLPRITRAQSMDVLSSQANIAGYKAVLLATQYYPKFMPMLMTAAGTVKPARVLIMGVGVAGLQAIATAKRLGAVVEAFDVRPSTKEQVESLGAKFVEVPMTDEEKKANDGVYAKEMSEDYKRRQGELVAKHASNADIIITTALIPGKPAPELIKPEVVASMKPGSVIVDLAAESGGNCKLTRAGEVIQSDNGVTLVGTTNLAGLVAQDASSLYSRNLLTFLGEMLKKDATALDINMDNEVVAKTRIVGDGQVLYKAN